MYKIIIDANVWIQYARAKDIAPLARRLLQYPVIAIVSNYFLSEIFDALVDNKWMHSQDAMCVISFIRKITFTDTEAAVYALNPDPKDNYLFDLAIRIIALLL